MQPLKTLTFIRIGSANSHKYKLNKKQLRSYKTICKKINKLWTINNIEYNLEDWANNIYNNDWIYKKDKVFFKGKLAPQELIDYKNAQEDLINQWCNENKELFETFNKLRKYVIVKENKFHSPPQTRGLYAFPQHRLETFLTHWDESKLDIKVKNIGKINEYERVRVKNFTTIHFNKLFLWCHFIKEAQTLKVDIKIKNSWVLINSKDYLKVLALWEKNQLKELKNTFGQSLREMENSEKTKKNKSEENKSGGDKNIKKRKLFKNLTPLKHCYSHIPKDDLEVFLVGV